MNLRLAAVSREGLLEQETGRKVEERTGVKTE